MSSNRLILAAVFFVVALICVEFAHADSYTQAEHQLGCATGTFTATVILDEKVFHEFLWPAVGVGFGCFAYESFNHDYKGADARFGDDLLWEGVGILGAGLVDGFTVEPGKIQFEAKL